MLIRTPRLFQASLPVMLGFVLVLLLVCVAPNGAAQGVRAGAVASESRAATREAMAVLRAGGNAVDAAVCAALVAGVTSPTSSGLGGGGFALVWDATKSAPFILDFREIAPQNIDAAAFDKRPFPDAERGRSVGVPGELAGLFELHRRAGKRTWAEVVAPAVRLAAGYAAEPHLAKTLGSRAESIQIDPNLKSVFYPGGRAAVAGRIVKNPKLLATLQRVSSEGPKAIYEGAIAADIIRAANAFHGALTQADLTNYRVKERTPLHVAWEGHDVFTMPPPSAGGILLAETLALFSRSEFEKMGYGTGEYQHLLAEAFRGAFADRMMFASDPDMLPVDTAKILAKQRMQKRKARISADRTRLLPEFYLDEFGTHHLSTADASGNMVALTTTVNHSFGARIVAPESGIVLNDELEDFSSKQDVASFGLVDTPNRARPGARPVSSMTPTIVVRRDPKPQAVLSIGGSGGMTISPNVTQLLVARLAFNLSPQKLLASPRFYVGMQKASLLLDEGVPKAVIADLERRGEKTMPMPFKGSAVQIIALEKNKLVAAADPRKQGVALSQ